MLRLLKEYRIVIWLVVCIGMAVTLLLPVTELSNELFEEKPVCSMLKKNESEFDYRIRSLTTAEQCSAKAVKGQVRQTAEVLYVVLVMVLSVTVFVAGVYVIEFFI